MASLALTTQEQFAKSFKIFREIAGNFPNTIEMLKFHLQAMMPKLRLPGSQRDHQFNVLSVGSGSGEMDIEILKIIKEEMQKSGDCENMKIYNRAIEPNGHLLDLYKAAIRNLPSFLKGEEQGLGGDRGGEVVTFELSKITIEEFMEKSDDNIKFDVIHFVHSIYYVNVEQSLVYCFEKILRENGLVIIVANDSPFRNTVLSKLDEEWHDPRDINANKVTPVDILHMAEKYKWKYEDYTQESIIDVSEIFDEHSKDGNMLLDFLTRRVNFRFAKDKSMVQETLELIRENTYVENGKYFGKGLDHFLFIYK
jgi:histamine N-methyltransferase